jgi:glycine dehydrogenase
MMGPRLTEATRYALLNANYLAASLRDAFPVLYTNKAGFVAHEMILDCRPCKAVSGITEGDIAKRLMDYGFHAPTVSFPVHGTLMIEPTESESLQELDRFVEAMRSIAAEVEEVISGDADREDNVLKRAPHGEQTVVSDTWDRPYSREKAAYPLAWIRENKFWPGCDRVDDAYGDRNLVAALEEDS